MQINWLILLNITLMQFFMFYGADNVSVSSSSSEALTTIAQIPLNEEQITTLVQQAVANCITPQTQKYAKTLQEKLTILLTFRSQLQPKSLSDKNAGLIIHQQNLYRGNIQADQHTDITASSSVSSRQGWGALFRNKLLIASVNEQAEISWAHEAASLLVQYWPTFVANKSQKKRVLIKSVMDNVAKYAATDAQGSTIAKVPLAQNQIIGLAQQAIANCITSQTRIHEVTLQKKLTTLLTFRSKAQPENLRSQSARLVLNQQSLHRGYIQADQYDDTDASSSVSSRQSWGALFRNKLLIESANEQAEISWARKTASLLVQYWPIYNTYVAQKRREYARKREQPYDSVKETQELLRKNRRHNDSPVPFVPVADEQMPASAAFDLLMHSNHDVLDFACLPDTDDNLLCFELPTPTIEPCDFSWIGEHNEN